MLNNHGNGARAHDAPSVALVHDYLTQRGGAERVVLAMLKAFPAAPLHTSLYAPDDTFPAFRHADVRPLAVDKLRVLRRHHRAALPLLAPAFSRLAVDADVVLCSSSGWAHGVITEGRKVVYCHAPARWLYQSDRYLRPRRVLARGMLRALRRPLLRWDRDAALRAHRYVANSTATRDQIRTVYGIDAEVLPPPLPFDSNGHQEAMDGLEPGYFLCVSRLLAYKNVDRIIDAFAQLPRERLVVVGSGPEEPRLRRHAARHVTFLRDVRDDQLRWLYANSAGVVAASYEDYGLTPLEGAALGSPAVVLRWGGFRDTVVEGETGVFFERPDARSIRTAVANAAAQDWSKSGLRSHAARYAEEHFIGRLRAIALEEAAAAGVSLPAVPAAEPVGDLVHGE